MPAFRCCRQQWSLADDDFVLSSFFSTAIRFCLFCWVLCTSTHTLGTLARTVNCDEGCCPEQEWIVWVYLLGELVLEFVEMVVNFLILFVSSSGTLQARNEENVNRCTAGNMVDIPGVNESRPKRLRVLLKARVALCFPEVCSSVVGLAVAFHPQLANQPACASSHISGLLAAYSIATMTVNALEIVAYLIMMDPAGCCSLGHISYVTDPDLVPNTAENSGRLAEQRASILSVSLEGGFRRMIGRRRSRTVNIDGEHALYNSHTSQLWHSRIRSLACACGGLRGHGSNTRNIHTSVHDAAKLFAVFFENTNYTVSDVASAIMLVSNEQRELWRRGHLLQRNVRKKLIEQMKNDEFLYGKTNYKYQPSSPVNLSLAAEFTEVTDAIYFWRYAMATYGWPLYVFGNPLTGCCRLCCKSPCCHCNEAAYEVVAGITEANIVHCADKNELFCSPFVVVLDHKKKALVIAIRGTLSMEDTITSLSVSLTRLYLNEPPLDTLNTQVHKGWFITATNILNELICKKILDRQFEEHPVYRQYRPRLCLSLDAITIGLRTIEESRPSDSSTAVIYTCDLSHINIDYQLVVVGHSLGGAVAAILSLLIKLNHKDHAHRLKSFGYSTPGCVFSYPLAKYCQDFVTTVVLDNDILPRLNWRSLLLLRAELKEKLETCNKPKYQVLYIDPLCAACKPTCSREDQAEEETALEEGSYKTTERLVSEFVKSVYDNPDWKSLGHFSGEQHVTFETAVSAAVCAGKWRRKALGVSDRRPSQLPVDSHEYEARRFSSVPAFLPGKVLQIDTEKKPLCPWLPWPYRTHCQLKWAANEDYCLMYFHRGPLSSHLPNHLNSVFTLVEKRHLQPRQLALVLDNVADSNGSPEMIAQTVEEMCASTSRNDELMPTSGARNMGEFEVVVEIPSSIV